MKVVQLTKYESDDGALFDSAKECADHEKMVKALKTIMAPLGKKPKDPGCVFANGGGYIQHNFEDVEKAKSRLVDLFNKGRKEKMSFSYLGRYLDDSLSVAYGEWVRLYCVDGQGREWGQPFYALTPGQGEQVPYTGK